MTLSSVSCRRWRADSTKAALIEAVTTLMKPMPVTITTPATILPERVLRHVSP